MKKNNKALIAVMVAWIMGSLMVRAAGNPANTNLLTMVTSPSALISWTIRQIASAESEVYAPAQVGEAMTKTSVREDLAPGNSNTLSVIDSLRLQSLSFSVARPEHDYFYLWTRLMDRDGYTLFYGGSKGLLEADVEGGWRVPDDVLHHRLIITSFVRIPFLEGTGEAKLLLRDASGTVRQVHDLNADGSGFWFPTRFAGWNGDLAVTVWTPEGATTYMTALNESNLEIPQMYVAQVPSCEIEGLWNYGHIDHLGYLSVVFPESSPGKGQSALLRFANTEAREFDLLIQSNRGLHPRGLWLKNVLTDETIYYSYPEMAALRVPLSANGLWEVLIDWGGFDDPPSYWWWGDEDGNDGGKG